MSGPPIPEGEETSLDQAARAAWLYYVGGQTQEQVARELGISRQRAQRLVSRAVAEGLIHFRLEHKLADCHELEARLKDRFGLRLARVVPGLGPGGDPVTTLRRNHRVDRGYHDDATDSHSGGATDGDEPYVSIGRVAI